MIAANLVTLKLLGSRKEKQTLAYVTKDWRRYNIATQHWSFNRQANYIFHGKTMSRIYFFDVDANPDRMRGFQFDAVIVDDVFKSYDKEQISDAVIPSMIFKEQE